MSHRLAILWQVVYGSSKFYTAVSEVHDCADAPSGSIYWLSSSNGNMQLLSIGEIEQRTATNTKSMQQPAPAYDA
eukprot:scaffold656149_cov61-Prasinocladus_malaysianus.AAC.1